MVLTDLSGKHLLATGYEVPMTSAYANGRAYFRTALDQVICYDLLAKGDKP